MTISLCLLLVSLMPRADFHWNRPQSQFITTCAAPGGPTQYIDFEGAVRAGKSTPCVAKLARYAQQYPGIHMAACRWTQDALDAQIKPLWRMMAAQRGLQLQWHSDEGYDEVVGTGARLYLRGLHASEDSQRYSKLAGLTLALIWIDQPEEISNTDEDVVLAYIPARLSQVGYPHEVWFTPNPVGNDHWVAQWFPLEGVRPNYHFIHTSIYDNRHILGDEYIRDMEDKHPEGSAFRMRFVDGNRGLGFAGKPVYAGYFSRVLRRGDVKLPWHVQPSVPYDRRFPIFEGWDFGYSHPAVLWSQFVNGQWRILAELQGTNESADAFGDRAVQLRGELFPQAFRFESVCDPAGFAKGAGLQGTVADLFAKKGVFFAAYDEVKGYNAPQVESNAIQTTMRIASTRHVCGSLHERQKEAGQEAEETLVAKPSNPYDIKLSDDQRTALALWFSEQIHDALNAKATRIPKSITGGNSTNRRAPASAAIPRGRMPRISPVSFPAKKWMRLSPGSWNRWAVIRSGPWKAGGRRRIARRLSKNSISGKSKKNASKNRSNAC
jgi:hypothetical protein